MRTYTHQHRQQLDGAIALYLEWCYRRRTRASVAELSVFLKRNPEYLTRISRSVSGVYLLEYLRSHQLREAERLLITTPLTVEEIALHAGFGTASTLHRRFKLAHGMSPGQFRKLRKCEKN